ncbi:MAG: type II toxin-antitoxin system prevent-host-death family antitoxin [Methylococcales bacterium]|nr:type II toxin-antitoxin system prevent-host-death family antitoxin [Methylococcales bacterium]MBT7410357.1 type II toxin-antitoxin system prevent-host-death family antitoxin [Methylococcales bacterium]
MDVINIYDAKTHLSQLLTKVVSGEEIIIGKNGNPIAKLIPYHTPAPRKLGQVECSDEPNILDNTTDDILMMFDSK